MSLSKAACDMALAIIVTDRPIVPASTTVTAATTLRALLTGVKAARQSVPPRLHRSGARVVAGMARPL